MTEPELRARVEQLERGINGVLLGSLLNVRRAAFGPALGVRYSETIRSDISNECRRLEDACHALLDGKDVAHPSEGQQTIPGT